MSNVLVNKVIFIADTSQDAEVRSTPSRNIVIAGRFVTKERAVFVEGHLRRDRSLFCGGKTAEDFGQRRAAGGAVRCRFDCVWNLG